MALARREMIDESVVGVYHCRARCVRRAFLCGDSRGGGSFDHRKTWIRERLKYLSEVMAVDVLGYAIMSNHVHFILRNRPDLVAQRSDVQVTEQWLRLYPKRRDEEGRALEPSSEDVSAAMVRPERAKCFVGGSLASVGS